jgi:flavodoxin
MSKNLIIYYSLEGNTRFVAQEIAKNIKADIIEIKPQKEIKSDNFMKFFWGGRQVFMLQKPKLLPFNQDFSHYENIFIGTPIWAWTISPPIRTLSGLNLIKDKNLYLFCTHEGDPRKALIRMQKLFSNENKIVSCEDFEEPLKNSEKTINKIKNWLKNFNK